VGMLQIVNVAAQRTATRTRVYHPGPPLSMPAVARFSLLHAEFGVLAMVRRHTLR
jgi:hypothetical protein